VLLLVISGTPDKVKAEITALAASYGVEEVVAVTITHDFDDWLRSYGLLADVPAAPALLTIL